MSGCIRELIQTLCSPYLSRYLGHKSPDETYYYYHLVEKAFDTIREKDSVSGKVSGGDSL